MRKYVLLLNEETTMGPYKSLKEAIEVKNRFDAHSKTVGGKGTQVRILGLWLPETINTCYSYLPELSEEVSDSLVEQWRRAID